MANRERKLISGQDSADIEFILELEWIELFFFPPKGGYCPNSKALSAGHLTSLGRCFKMGSPE